MSRPPAELPRLVLQEGGHSCPPPVVRGLSGPRLARENTLIPRAGDRNVPPPLWAGDRNIPPPLCADFPIRVLPRKYALFPRLLAGGYPALN
jgi:hypothetical protein